MMYDDILKLYHLRKENIDIYLSFIAGLFSSYSYFKCTKTKSPIWATKENVIYKNSTIIENLYTEYKTSGDKEYELYGDTITFCNDYVSINDKKYFRK